MSSSRIPAVSTGIGRVTERDQSQDQAAKGFAPAKGAASVSRESYISSVSTSRQPPRLRLDDVVPQMASSSLVLFETEVENLARRPDSEIAGDLAELYLTHTKDAKSSGDPVIAEAFEFLGDVMLNYEHLRLLRTGGLG